MLLLVNVLMVVGVLGCIGVEMVVVVRDLVPVAQQRVVELRSAALSMRFPAVERLRSRDIAEPRNSWGCAGEANEAKLESQTSTRNPMAGIEMRDV